MCNLKFLNETFCGYNFVDRPTLKADILLFYPQGEMYLLYIRNDGPLHRFQSLFIILYNNTVCHLHFPYEKLYFLTILLST